MIGLAEKEEKREGRKITNKIISRKFSRTERYESPA